MNGTIPLLLLYAFMACRGENFTFKHFKSFMHQKNVDNHNMEASKLEKARPIKAASMTFTLSHNM
jgi:hypothetical protein